MEDIVIISAPEIPVAEIKKLRREVEKALADSDYPIVVNYECQLISTAENPVRHVLLVIALDIPTAELDALREHFIKAAQDSDYVVAVNYEIGVEWCAV